MEAVWQLEMTWPASRDTFLSAVREYGGDDAGDGRAVFHRYRSAEICAQILSLRLGHAPEMRLLLRA